jgi:serine/threonine-protein kinase
VNSAAYPPWEDDEIAAAVAEYLEARDSGRPLAPVEWLARHQEIAGELREFLDDVDGLISGLRAFRGATRGPDLATAERFVGDYELLERIGGNMGVVYRAQQRSLPREVAVKLLLRPGAGHRARFRFEAESMARLDHPHIVRILEVSREDGTPFFSMEWCPGETLATRIAEYRGRPDEAVKLVEQVAGAIDYAHKRGFLHRDLKPANILMDKFGGARVADFGLAIPVHRTGDENWAGGGTPAYMAPEQLTGEVTVATDVYGLGAILYELLTGHTPHGATTLTATLHHVRAADIVPPARLDPRIDPDLDAICQKCLSKDPAARYSSAAELAKDLRRYGQGLPTIARPLGSLGRVAHAVRQARAAGDFRTLAPSLLAQSVFVLASNAAVFALLQAGAARLWVWATLFVSYVPLFVMLARDRLAARGHNPLRFHLWAVWAGHASACLAVFIGLGFAAGDDFVRGILSGYIGCAGLNTLAFVVMGSVFAGRQYVLGLAWAVAAIAMGAFLPYAPLIYAVLMAACSLISGLQLQAIGVTERIE